jgi:hypothetical protein
MGLEMEPLSEIETQDASTGDPLTTESMSDHHCEGRVLTCAHCGRPASECDGESCEHLLETRDWMVPGYSTR